MNVVPAVAEEAFRSKLVVLQVNTGGVAMLRSGVVISWVTVTLSFLIQPFAEVAVT